MANAKDEWVDVPLNEPQQKDEWVDVPVDSTAGDYIDVGTAPVIKADYSTSNAQPQIQNQRVLAFANNLKEKFPELGRMLLDKFSPISEDATMTAAVRGFNQGATQGHSDEILGTLDPSKTIDEYRRLNESSRKSHNIVYPISEAIGFAASPVNKVLKGLSGILAQGALYGEGSSDKSITDPNILKDATLGMGANALGYGIGAGMSSLKENFPGIVKGVGNLLQKTQEGSEKVSGLVGKHAVPDEIFTVYPKTTGSKYTADLAKKANRGRFDNPQEADLFEQMVNQDPDIIQKPLASLRADQQQKAVEIMKNTLQKRGLTTTDEAQAMELFREIKERPNSTLEDLLTSKIKENAESSIKRLNTTVQSYPNANIVDEQASRLVTDAKQVYDRIQQKNLNAFLEDPANAVINGKQLDIGGGRVDVSALGQYQAPKPTQEQMISLVNEARQKLIDIQKGKKALSWGSAAAPYAADVAGGVGRFLERKGTEMAEKRAQNFLPNRLLQNPQLLESMAQDGGPLGDAARYVLQGYSEQGKEGLITRSFMASMNPSFRRYFGIDKANEDRGNPTPTLP